MKIRHPRLISAVAQTVSVGLRAWMQTNSIRYRPLANYNINDRPELLGDARYIYGFWHEHLLTPAYAASMADTSILIGTHADGEMITQVVKKLGMGVIRGSTTRGGAAALISMIRAECRHLSMTPDGPRGPRRKCQMGIIYLASVTGLPIVCFGLGYKRAWRAKSWDQLVVPSIFTKIRAVSSHAVRIPERISITEMEQYRREVERLLNLTSDVAQHWATTGEFDPLGYEPPAELTPTSGRTLFHSRRQKPFSPST